MNEEIEGRCIENLCDFGGGGDDWGIRGYGFILVMIYRNEVMF